ncbi:LysR family transcriptional regulator [Isoptericola nanjingensis]|uniref:LysR family transcriptional regulator n=1 Tax=Isoptericola TaxID=254250 RepID=UPI0035ECE8B9
MPTITQLRALYAMSEHGSLTSAAAALGYTVSGVSRQLDALEAVIGGSLLFRGSSGWMVTNLGRDVLDEAEPLLLAHDRIRLIAARHRRTTRSGVGRPDAARCDQEPRLAGPVG